MWLFVPSPSKRKAKQVNKITIEQSVEALGPHYATHEFLKSAGWSLRAIEAAVRRGTLAWKRDGSLKVIKVK